MGWPADPPTGLNISVPAGRATAALLLAATRQAGPSSVASAAQRGERLTATCWRARGGGAEMAAREPGPRTTDVGPAERARAYFFAAGLAAAFFFFAIARRGLRGA